MSRTVVMRSDISSTSPTTSPTWMVSPTPNWFSMRMNMPEKKSFTSDCAPKPMATPTTPADAISGATFTPS